MPHRKVKHKKLKVIGGCIFIHLVFSADGMYYVQES